MASSMKEFEHLKIQLEDIKKATDNFGNNVIGKGGFGKVYEGELSHSMGRTMVAIKRLDRKLGQGDPEFLKEIMMLSLYTHKNLISLLGFCDQDGEKILVYEHAANGSLDRHLSSTTLTWTQRIKICIDAARGINYLHDHKGTQQRVLHRDIKSSNILLDNNWNAKVSDMGLSKIGPANQPRTFVITNVVGTPGYCDPQYMETYTLTKESDVYSFGVVLFEVLCGRLCYNYNNDHLDILVRKWKQSYEDNKLHEIIFQDLTPPLNPTSLETFSNIAFRCLHINRERRPLMSLVVEKLEIALEFQEGHSEGVELLGRTNSGTIVSYSSPSMLTTNVQESSQLDYSPFRLTCEVLGANIVKNGSKTIVVYPISIKDLYNHHWSVKRRFQDFENLHKRIKKFPEYNLHLPPKHLLSDVDAIQEHCQLLDTYIKRLMQNPNVSQSHEVYDFLSVDSKTYDISFSVSMIQTVPVSSATTGKSGQT